MTLSVMKNLNAQPIAGAEPVRLQRAFYQRGAEELARDLIGTILVHRAAGHEYRARIVETEAYVGSHDLACHASKGRTQRTEVMFRAGGCAYVYFIYGMYDMLNIVASAEGDPQAVLVRAAETMGAWQADLSGPGKLTRAMRITRADNGRDLTGRKLFLMAAGGCRPKIGVSRRIGVDYARDWKNAMLRFFDESSGAVSRARG
jgi:DNA-3-methyladenine glycosylase